MDVFTIHTCRPDLKLLSKLAVVSDVAPVFRLKTISDMLCKKINIYTKPHMLTPEQHLGDEMG